MLGRILPECSVSEIVGYYVDTVGKNTAAIKAYIQNQLKVDLVYDQIRAIEQIFEIEYNVKKEN